LRRITHVSRTSNEEVDILANIRYQYLPIPAGVFWEEIIERSIQGAKTSGPKKQKPQPAADSGAETAKVDDGPEPEEVMMVEVTWM
jgi:hypothetical protein